MSIDGAKRISSVSGLNDSPSTPTVFPERFQSDCSTNFTKFIFCASFTFNTSRSKLHGTPNFSPILINADKSFGKQNPPKPMPGLRNDFEIRVSAPIPSRSEEHTSEL